MCCTIVINDNAQIWKSLSSTHTSTLLLLLAKDHKHYSYITLIYKCFIGINWIIPYLLTFAFSDYFIIFPLFVRRHVSFTSPNNLEANYSIHCNTCTLAAIYVFPGLISLFVVWSYDIIKHPGFKSINQIWLKKNPANIYIFNGLFLIL